MAGSMGGEGCHDETGGCQADAAHQDLTTGGV